MGVPGFSRAAWRGPMVIASVALALVLLSTPGHARDDSASTLELSGDGVNYAPQQPLEMFGPGREYVPGESRSGVVWVRNAGNQAKRFSLAVATTDVQGKSPLASHLQLAASAPGFNAVTTVPARRGLCTTMLAGWQLAPGQALPIDFSLALDLAAPNSTRHQGMGFDMVFLLQDGGSPLPVSPCATAVEAGNAGASMGRATVGHDPGATPGPGDDPGAMAGPGAVRPGVDMLQSNVVATSHSPWPWLVILCAGTYAGISLRSRGRKP